MAFSYKYADGAVHRVSAQVVGEICERIEAETGRCTPEDLLNSARNPESPLYKEFEWDDTVAAEKYRIWQSAQLIRHIRIIQSDDAQERQEYRERAFVSVPGREGAYVSMDTALHREEYRRHLLEQAKREVKCFIAKYRRIEELAGVVAEMENFLKL